MFSLIDKTDEEQMSFYRCFKASWLFGLRPSELDKFILGEQEEALESILNSSAKRPTPEWMDKYLRIKGKKYKPEGHKFDCYSGRKGFIDLMLSPDYNQKN